MGLINIGAGISAVGESIARTAGIAALEEQRSQLETQKITLASQLAGQQYDVQAKRLALIPQQASIDAYLKATGYSGGLADFGMGGSSPADGAASPQPSSGAPATSPAAGSGGGAPVPAATGQPSTDQAAPSSQTRAPVIVDKSGKALGIALPPGMTAQQAAILGPAKLSEIWEKWSSPEAVRPGAALTYFNFSTGKQETLYQQPEMPKGTLYDQATNSIVQVRGGTAAIEASAGAESRGKSQGELPAELTKIGATGEQARTTAGFQKGLDVATDLVPSYDPATQTTTMVTKAEALARTKEGKGVTAPPVSGAAAPSQGNIGQQNDGSFKTTDGTTIPAPPKTAATSGGFQSAPSEAQKATQSTYPEIIKGWQESVQPAAQAEQRFTAMADALKATQSGAWASTKAEIGRQLIAAGMSADTVKNLTNIDDPAQAQIVLKNNFGAALSELGASKLGRITQNEIFALQKNLSNPDLEPGANLAIIAQGIGIARFQQHLANDWNTAIRMGYADPLTYQEQWMKANPLQKFIDGAAKEIGPLKGMASTGPQEGQTIRQGDNLFKVIGGKPVYQGPAAAQ